MLSERERRELERIERELGFDDPRFAASFRPGFGARLRRQIVRPRSVMIFGALVMVVGAVLGLDDTFLQGLLIASAGGTWWWWITQEPPTDRAPGSRRPGTQHRRS